ncbi:MAG: membrane metalloprotease [Flavobacteriaceae bacterium]
MIKPILKISYSRFLLSLIVIFLLTACKKDDNNPPEDPKLANKQATGSSSEDFLRDTDFTSLTLEFVYPEGFQPEDGTINSLTDFIQGRLNKPVGFTVVQNVIPTPEGSSFNINKIISIEEEHRINYNEGNNLAVYIFFSNKSSSNDTPTRVTLGSAYRNTSIVIYKKTIRDIAISEGISIPIAERTTLNHEFGHLLGLVNLQLDDIHQEHEDTQNNKHCMVEDCLMYFETSGGRSVITSALLSKSMDSELDPLCIEDLQAKGGK